MTTRTEHSAGRVDGEGFVGSLGGAWGQCGGLADSAEPGPSSRPGSADDGIAGGPLVQLVQCAALR